MSSRKLCVGRPGPNKDVGDRQLGAYKQTQSVLHTELSKNGKKFIFIWYMCILTGSFVYSNSLFICSGIHVYDTNNYQILTACSAFDTKMCAETPLHYDLD